MNAVERAVTEAADWLLAIEQEVTCARSTVEWTRTETLLFHSTAHALLQQLPGGQAKSKISILANLRADADCLLDKRRFALYAVPYQLVSPDSLSWFANCTVLLAIIELAMANSIEINSQESIDSRIKGNYLCQVKDNQSYIF
jgi:hypothetical protein